MRDPHRIPEILELVREAWTQHPDQRLTQLILNACRDHPAWPDVFNVEDDLLVSGLQAMLLEPSDLELADDEELVDLGAGEPAQLCPHCSNEIPTRAVKCRHCGKFTTEFPDLVLDLRAVEADPAFASKLAEWPTSNLRSALEEYQDDYPPPQQKALLLELDRRVLKSGD